MINIPKIPKLPSRQELEFKEKTLLIEILDQFRTTHKLWYLLLVGAVIAAYPVSSYLTARLRAVFIARQPLLSVVENPQRPTDLVVASADFLRVSPGVFSAYANIANPNSDWSVWSFDYKFVFRSASGGPLHTIRGQSFLLPGSSRFVIEPAVPLSETPASVEIQVTSPRWTNRANEFLPEFAVLQKRWGDTADKFFVEGVVKNPYSFLVKKVAVEVIIFDETNKQVLAVSRTVVDDLKSFEERYFRMLWPVSQSQLLPKTFGQIQVSAAVNPLEPGFGLEEGEPVPAR